MFSVWLLMVSTLGSKLAADLASEELQLLDVFTELLFGPCNVLALLFPPFHYSSIVKVIIIN